MNSLNLLWHNVLTPRRREMLCDAGLLLVRLQLGIYMIYGHGWRKLADFGTISESFPDPLGVGSPMSLSLAVLAEFFGSILLAIGLATRFAAFLLVSTMAVAGLIIHANDPFRTKELALVYLAAYIALLLTGPGRFSIDHVLVRSAKRTPDPAG